MVAEAQQKLTQSMSPLAGSGFPKEDGEKWKGREREFLTVGENSSNKAAKEESRNCNDFTSLQGNKEKSKYAVNSILCWQMPHAQLTGQSELPASQPTMQC